MRGGPAIALIIIDGYNVIGTQHRDLRAAREELIRLVAAYNGARHHDITVVFDGWKDGGRVEAVSKQAGIRIIYSRLGERADDAIKRLIASERREWIVVSSDTDIARAAWASGAVPIASAAFLSLLEEDRFDQAEEDEDDDSASRSRRGRALSRKERAVKRALSRLA